MQRVLVTADVNDYAKWEEGFLSHGDLFRTMALRSLHYGTSGGNTIAVLGETEDLAKYMEVLESSATAEAMEVDGIKRDTVKVTVLDGEFKGL